MRTLMRTFLINALTVFVSLFLVPIVFIVLAILFWNIVLPLIFAAMDYSCNGSFTSTFSLLIALPVTLPVFIVRNIHQGIHEEVYCKI